MLNHSSDRNAMYEYLIGVDGGGTQTRVRVARNDGREIAHGTSGPSGLMHGANLAWRAVLAALDAAFIGAGLTRPALAQIAAGFGMAGAHNRQWTKDFIDREPGFGNIVVETDAFTTLLGAHQGKPGAIIATGTGSVGEALLATGMRREVGGWGFPSGDAASGGWLGLQAIGHAEAVLDDRAQTGDFARAVIDACGGDRDGMFTWLARAGQTEYARLAPLVVDYAAHDPVARSIMIAAGKEVEKIARALDASAQLPIALCGGLAAPLLDYLPELLARRVVLPHADSAAGALLLVSQRVGAERRS